MDNFKGTKYRLSDKWTNIIHIDKTQPINYLEIGVFYGANLISFAENYANHKDTKLYCIDPWLDYHDYPEYKNSQENTYTTFIQNIKNCKHKDKIIIKRGFSNIEVLNLKDDFFDIVYIDGNHEPEYVLEDAVLSFRKLKQNGIMIFDDYGWGGKDLTQRGIDAFISGYYKKIKVLGLQDSQMFIQKI